MLNFRVSDDFSKLYHLAGLGNDNVLYLERIDITFRENLSLDVKSNKLGPVFPSQFEREQLVRQELPVVKSSGEFS